MTDESLYDAVSDALQRVSERNPLVHTITNFVTVNDCANIILAAGGSPTMAHDIREVEEIAAVSQALVLNMGAIGDLDAMLRAAITANRRGIPIVLDPVAAGASKLRRESCAALLGQASMTVIRGNASEIKALAEGAASTRGVDVGDADRITEQTLSRAAQTAQALSRSQNAVVAISGPIDLIADHDRVFLLRNGCPEMSRITGSGCMLTALIGAFLGANPKHPLEATIAAVGMMGYAGELAQKRMQSLGGGTATFRTCLIDAVSLMTPQQLQGGLKLEGI